MIVGGDFRALLNALSNIDEKTLARLLPFRPGEKGVHDLEGLAQGVWSQPVEIQAALALELGEKLPPAATELARAVSSAQLTQAKNELKTHAAALRGFCEEEYAMLKRQIEAGANPRRVVAVVGDVAIEAVVAGLISPEVRPTGWRARLLRWWRK